MTRKDFELIAATLAAWDDGVNGTQRDDIARQLADALRATNPQFNRDKFIRACGGEP